MEMASSSISEAISYLIHSKIEYELLEKNFIPYKAVCKAAA